MAGVETGSRGEGLGDVKGEAVELIVRASAGGCGPRPGGGPGVAFLGRGEPAFEGVPLRCSQGAGERERMMFAPRIACGLVVFSFAPFHRQSAPNTASSSALPFSEAGALLNTSSSLSVFSSSPRSSSSSTGWHSSYIRSETMVKLFLCFCDFVVR